MPRLYQFIRCGGSPKAATLFARTPVEPLPPQVQPRMTCRDGREHGRWGWEGFTTNAENEAFPDSSLLLRCKTIFFSAAAESSGLCYSERLDSENFAEVSEFFIPCYAEIPGNTRKYAEQRSILFRLLFRIFPHRRRRRSGYFQFGRTPRPPAFRYIDSTFQRYNARPKFVNERMLAHKRKYPQFARVAPPTQTAPHHQRAKNTPSCRNVKWKYFINGKISADAR